MQATRNEGENNINSLSNELRRSYVLRRVGTTYGYYIAKSIIDYSLKTPLSYKMSKEFSNVIPNKIRVQENPHNTKLDEVDISPDIIKEGSGIMNILPREDKMSIYRTSIELKKVLGKDLYNELEYITFPIRDHISELCKNPV